MDWEQVVSEKFEIIAPMLDEAQRRIWAASEAITIGRGGVAIVYRATGIARSTIERGINDIESGSYMMSLPLDRGRGVRGLDVDRFR